MCPQVTAKRRMLAHREVQRALTEQAVLCRMANEGTSPFVTKLWRGFHGEGNLTVSLAPMYTEVEPSSTTPLPPTPRSSPSESVSQPIPRTPVGSTIVTTNLPRVVCPPQGKGMLIHGNYRLMARLSAAERVYVSSCASVKLLAAFSRMRAVDRESFARLGYDAAPNAIRLQLSPTLFSSWAPP
jgi:hypothetical protein